MRSVTAATVEAGHHGLVVAHPGEALEQAGGTGVAAELGGREHEFDEKGEGSGNEENTLVARQRAVPKIAVDFCWGEPSAFFSGRAWRSHRFYRPMVRRMS